MTDRPPLPPFDRDAVFTADRIAVRFQYESHDTSGQWWRSYGNELWEFDEHGLEFPIQ